MAKELGLVRRGNRWTYRRRIPEDLRASFGKREIKESLHTEVYAEAKVRRNAAAQKWDQLFAQRRRQISFEQVSSDIIRYVAEQSQSRTESLLKEPSSAGREEAIYEARDDIRLYREQPDSEEAQIQLDRLRQTIFQSLAIVSHEMPVPESAPPDITSHLPEDEANQVTDLLRRAGLELARRDESVLRDTFPQKGTTRLPVVIGLSASSVATSAPDPGGATSKKQAVTTRFEIAQTTEEQLREIDQEIKRNNIETEKARARSEKTLDQFLKTYERDTSRSIEAVRNNGCNELHRQRFFKSQKQIVAVIDQQTELAKVVANIVLRDPSAINDLKRDVAVAERLTMLAANTQLNFADAALQRNCLDWADAIYRNIAITHKAGTATSRRAKIGIDDVRAARSR